MTTQSIYRQRPLPTLRPVRERANPDRPVARLQAAGVPALSNAEVLALITAGNADAADVALCQQALTTFDGWLGLQRASLAELACLPGMTDLRAARLKAALDLGRRVCEERYERAQIKSPADAATLLQAAIGDKDQEHLVVLVLDTKNRMLGGVHTVYIGSLNSALVRVGEVFRPAIRLNAASILVGHNHPSQDPTPSPEDILLTRQIVEAGKLMDIEAVDHLVVCATRYVSLRERGLGFPS
jgi:DNA repair protein RadC